MSSPILPSPNNAFLNVCFGLASAAAISILLSTLHICFGCVEFLLGGSFVFHVFHGSFCFAYPHLISVVYGLPICFGVGFGYIPKESTYTT
jgi:hypothetical protein